MKMNLKTLLFAGCAACALMNTAYARPSFLSDNPDGLYASGLYFGAQVGYTSLHNSHAFNQTIGGALADSMLFGISHIGFAGYLGYSFNDYFGVDLDLHRQADMSEEGGFTAAKNHTRVYSVDLFAKGSLALNKFIRPFAKAGAGYVYQDILTSDNNGDTVLFQSKTNKVLPAAAAGVDFHFTKSFAVDLSWTHWFGMGEIHSIDFPALGVSYTFGG